MTSVSIVDYGLGNLLSVIRAFEYFNIKANIISTAEEILASDRLILPGVGAFSDGMSNINSMGLAEPIKIFVNKGKPFLGICLGMQMMMTKSNEFGQQLGLNLIEGEVISIPSFGVDGHKHKVPHIGWSKLLCQKNSCQWDKSILEDIEIESAVYFVHSYKAIPKDPYKQLAYVLYNGLEITAVIFHENMYGCQFHPEKSGAIGLKIIENFLKI